MNLTTDPTNQKILLLLSQGMTAKEISSQIYLSKRTVIERIQNLKAHFGARSYGQMLLNAERAGVIPVSDSA
jgi:DNA-binding NarL/FixJ family response regulator